MSAVLVANTITNLRLSNHARVSLSWRFGLHSESDMIEFYSTHRPVGAERGCVSAKGKINDRKVTLIVDPNSRTVVTALPKSGLFSSDIATGLRDFFERSRAKQGSPSLKEIAKYRELFEESNGDLSVVMLDFMASHNVSPLSIEAEETKLGAEKSAEKTPPESKAKEAKILFDKLRPWINSDELYLLGIPESDWDTIWQAGSVTGLEETSLDPSYLRVLKAYTVKSDKSMVEWLYSPDAPNEHISIASRALGTFFTDLDPAQKKILERIKDDGPYLIKGSAGTGKSTIGIHRIKDLVVSRVSESLFEESRPRYAIITFTNVLVGHNKALFEGIIPPHIDAEVNHTTIDKVAAQLATEGEGDRDILDVGGITTFLARWVLPILDPNDQAIIKRLQFEYVAEELEHVIAGYNLKNENEYLRQKRVGRKRGLQQRERLAIWRSYVVFKNVCQEKRVSTFNLRRASALQFLREHPRWPRYNAAFVDEAQDLPEVARLLCLELVTDSRYLLLAADTAQSIYIVPPTWKETHADLSKRRPLLLEKNYRSTHQISEAIQPLRVDLGDVEDLSKQQKAVRDGPKPRWIEAPVSEHTGRTVDLIKEIAFDVQNPVNAGQIAVILRDNISVQKYLAVLKSHRLPASVVDRANPISLHRESVHVITAHSSKGLEFPIVIVPDVSGFTYPSNRQSSVYEDSLRNDELLAADQRLLYVALSRASNFLFMLADPSNPSPYLAKLSKSECWDA